MSSSLFSTKPNLFGHTVEPKTQSSMMDMVDLSQVDLLDLTFYGELKVVYEYFCLDDGERIAFLVEDSNPNTNQLRYILFFDYSGYLIVSDSVYFGPELDSKAVLSNAKRQARKLLCRYMPKSSQAFKISRRVKETYNMLSFSSHCEMDYTARLWLVDDKGEYIPFEFAEEQLGYGDTRLSKGVTSSKVRFDQLAKSVTLSVAADLMNRFSAHPRQDFACLTGQRTDGVDLYGHLNQTSPSNHWLFGSTNESSLAKKAFAYNAKVHFGSKASDSSNKAASQKENCRGDAIVVTAERK